MSSSVALPTTQDQVQWLYQQYSPWCLLHLLLKNHSHLFSTVLLEELLAPFNTVELFATLSCSSSSFSTSPSQLNLSPDSPPFSSHQHHQGFVLESPLFNSQPIRPKVAISRYLIQRLHFGYYGTKDTISESAVRYLTARARLEFGYFIIRGRAFWNVTSEDLGLQSNFSSLVVLEQEEQDGKTGGKSGTQDISRRHRRDQQPNRHLQQQRQQQNQDGNDQSTNKDDDANMVGSLEASTYIGRIHGRLNKLAKSLEFDEEEKRKSIVKGNRQCEEREEKLLMVEAIRYLQRKQPEVVEKILQSFSQTGTSSTLLIDTPTISERQASAIYWTRVALTYLIDTENDLEKHDALSIPSSPFLSRRTDVLWMNHLENPPSPILKLKELARHSHPYGGMGLVQDDSRLFQISSGIFNDLATHPKKAKKPAPTIIDGPFSYSHDIVHELVTEYGYMPLPEDDADRKINFNGGMRASTGATEIFPSDGSHIAKPGQKGEGTSIWYFYELQRLEVMVGYLIHRAPEVLDLLFQRGFELLVRQEQGGPGISRSQLLQCCIPGCHAMVRHVYQAAGKQPTMSAHVIVRTVERELLGNGEKPKRFEFQQDDFAAVLRGLAPGNVEDSLNILLGLGMKPVIVQNRLMELLQTPASTAPVDIENSILTALRRMCNPEGEPFDSTHSPTSEDVVNLALQLSFEVQMDPSEAINLEWKCSFEETLLNLKRENLTVHEHVSNWILASLDSSQAGFKICFDHAILDALSGATEWNLWQLKRLKGWVKVKEGESYSRSNQTGRRWEEVKEQLTITEHGNLDGQDDVMHGYEQDKALVGLDVEWTTNDWITLSTSAVVEDLPEGDEVIRVGCDGRLLIDNGFPGREPILCRFDKEDYSVLSSNMRVFNYLKSKAVVEERHWIWLAMGLATVSLQGLHVVELGWTTRNPRMLSFPVRMGCSPVAYQLVWMLALVYIPQLMTGSEDCLSPLQIRSQCEAKIRELQQMLTNRLRENAWLIVELLSELKDDISNQLSKDK
ncbi:hypothetical protein BGZ76_007783 [Entomortierella beljakovae]|nr:hypothetical protein BGZ76_007783 [Entomortierella beljakovae]